MLYRHFYLRVALTATPHLEPCNALHHDHLSHAQHNINLFFPTAKHKQCLSHTALNNSVYSSWVANSLSPGEPPASYTDSFSYPSRQCFQSATLVPPTRPYSSPSSSYHAVVNAKPLAQKPVPLRQCYLSPKIFLFTSYKLFVAPAGLLEEAGSGIH